MKASELAGMYGAPVVSAAMKDLESAVRRVGGGAGLVVVLQGLAVCDTAGHGHMQGGWLLRAASGRVLRGG